jgi:hypothetical protein
VFATCFQVEKLGMPTGTIKKLVFERTSFSMGQSGRCLHWSLTFTLARISSVPHDHGVRARNCTVPHFPTSQIGVARRDRQVGSGPRSDTFW